MPGPGQSDIRKLNDQVPLGSENFKSNITPIAIHRSTVDEANKRALTTAHETVSENFPKIELVDLARLENSSLAGERVATTSSAMLRGGDEERADQNETTERDSTLNLRQIEFVSHKDDEGSKLEELTDDGDKRISDAKTAKAVQGELGKLLGKERIADLKAGKEFKIDVTLKSGGEDVTLRAHYRPKYKNMIISPVNGSAVMRLGVGKDGTVTSIGTDFDKGDGFRKLFEANGYKGIAAALPAPGDEPGAGSSEAETNPSERKIPKKIKDESTDTGEIRKPIFRRKDDPKLLRADAKIEEMEKFIKKEKKGELDYSKIITKDKPVLFVGDDHNRHGEKDELAAKAKELRAAGVTHFGIEMIPKSMQPTLNRYFDGDKKAREEIQRYLKANWTRIAEGIPERYMKLLDAMKEQRIRPVGIDDNDHEGEKVRDRNATWSKTVADIIKADPKNRMVVLGGSDHFGYKEGMHANEMLRDRYGINSTVLTFGGGIAPGEFLKDLQDHISAAAKKAGLANERFSFDLNPTFPRGADKVLHLPQKQKHYLDF